LLALADILRVSGESDRNVVIYKVIVCFVPTEKTYSVRIAEIFERTVTVKSSNREEALGKVKAGYRNEVHVLDADDFKDVSFKIANQERSR
jgi:hypothetical protein